MKKDKYKMDKDNFRLFYQIQYDRIDKLETKRENFCNFVLTLSSAIIVFSLNTDNRLPKYTNYLIVLICIINLAAIIFINKTRPFIKMHQKRADLASKSNENSFNKVKRKIGKANSNEDYLNRNNIYTYLHVCLLLFMIALLALENNWFCLLMVKS